MSKFKIGDKVIYDGFLGQYKGEIFGISKKDVKGGKYAITVKGNLDYINLLVEEEDLQLVEIEVGDIVKFPNGNKGLVEHIAKKKLFDGEELALIDMIDTNATNTDYKLISTCVIELVEKGGN